MSSCQGEVIVRTPLPINPPIVIMKTLLKLSALITFAAAALTTQAAPKNWTPTEQKIYAQTLSEQIMANHPELLIITWHGGPPGRSKLDTIVACSYGYRMGNADDPDDFIFIEVV